MLIIAIVSTDVIMELNEDVGFGVGWGLPWAWSAGLSFLTVVFVKKSLREENAEWRAEVAGLGIFCRVILGVIEIPQTRAITNTQSNWNREISHVEID